MRNSSIDCDKLHTHIPGPLPEDDSGESPESLTLHTRLNNKKKVNIFLMISL